MQNILEEKKIVEEYLELHEKYIKKFDKNRTLVLMQVGKFYEAYAITNRGPNLQELEDFTDASIAHKGKDKSIINISNPLMWGFPTMTSTKYMGILIENGYRLIILDQVGTKPKIKREVVAIHSPGTYMEFAYKPSSNFVINICIEEIVQKNNQILSCVGMSAIDVTTGQVYIHESHAESNDDKLGLDEAIRFINSLSPKEIIINTENLKKITQSFMIEYLELEGKFYQFKEINKEHTKLNYQKRLLEKVYPNCENMTNIIDTLELSTTIYARKSLVVLLTYISDHLENLVKDINQPKFFLGSNNLILGNDAINQLNIIDNKNITIPGSVKYHNLLDVINKADTHMGKRYIKLKLMSPYIHSDVLNNIYDTVDILMKKNTHVELSGYLKKVHDIERLYRRLRLLSLHPMHIIDLMNSLVTIREMFIYIKNNESGKFIINEYIKKNGLIDALTDLNEILTVNIDVDKAKSYTISDIKENIFNAGVHEDIDELQGNMGNNHEIMNELLDKLDTMIDDKKSKGKKIVLKNNNQDGYYYQLTTKRYQTLKQKFDKIKVIKLSTKSINISDIEVKNIKSNVKLTLPFLKNQTADIDDLTTKISNLTHNYYKELLDDIHIRFDDHLVKIIEIVTQIDYYTTIAKVAKTFNYCRPIINNDRNDSSYITADEIRHPIVERIVGHEYVPHDINIGRDIKGMMIYGLNSAGKSVLMKAIGISIIMVQAGFFAPAKRFVFYPYKSMYTRITGMDNLFRGLSSFSLEILELNCILKRSNESTLVLGDEISRGSEHISGNAIVATTLLKLSELKSTFVFATHLHELMELDEIKTKKDIKAFHLSVTHDETEDRLIYDRLLKNGTGERIYGITVAKYIIKDNDFIKKALEFKNILVDRNKDSSQISTKKSKYNNELLMDQCSLCNKKNTFKNPTPLETHHINHQKDCDIDGFVNNKQNNKQHNKQHIKKNQLFNLMVLCNECHDKVHSNKIEIEGIKMTSNGQRVIVKNKN
jgi:DNA mismatch repair protein MutS